MTLAQERLNEVVAWVRTSSAPRTTPLGGATVVGAYAVFVASDLDAAPMAGFNTEALPLYIPQAQSEGVRFPAKRFEAPASQIRVGQRLFHLIWKIEAGVLPPCRVVGLDDSSEPLQAAIDRAGAGDTDLAAIPLIMAPLWALLPIDRNAIAAKLSGMA